MIKSTTMLTSAGRHIDLMGVRAKDIDFIEIGYSLSNIMRFTGHAQKDWSVAQHCLLMAEMVTRTAAPYALLHDAHEAFSNDLSSPFKAAMAARIPGGDRAYRLLCDDFDAAIYAAAELIYPVPALIEAEIKEADQILCSAEQIAIMKDAVPEFDCGDLWKKVVEQPEEVVRHNWGNACQRLLPRFNLLKGDVA
ncbi:MAG: hypothetical protein Unbinned664contig1000_70 [Prokaryotic dsDNA virus sp.]|nr:MAG: hypothetical protein Unbinned664contig1000_70 [Prokaryotic dsDNA virus sp.]|tara:strand:- start:19206 stop:19787 length:582 start_codon:yes stop_codon:yes gene_type:complete